MSLETRKNTIQDPGAELLDQATGLWEQYGRMTLYVVVGVLVLGIAGYYWKTGQDRRENSAAEKLAQANELFWRADYDRSRQIAQEVSKQFSGTPSGTDALRISGDNAYWRGNWKEAIADYKAYLKANNSGLIASTVKRSLAYSLESDGQYAEAAAMYTSLVGVFERESSGELLCAAARCQLALNKPDEAKKLFQRVIDEFPDSSFQLQARIELGKLSPALLN